MRTGLSPTSPDSKFLPMGEKNTKDLIKESKIPSLLTSLPNYFIWGLWNAKTPKDVKGVFKITSMIGAYAIAEMFETIKSTIGIKGKSEQGIN